MGPSKKKHHKPEPEEADWHWLTQAGLQVKKVANYHIARIAVWAWLLILTFLLGVPSLRLLQLNYMASEPVTSDTLVAKVSDMQIEDHSTGQEVILVYRVRLKQNDKEIICSLYEDQIRLWYQLEIGKSYEFTVTQTPRHCYVNNVTKIDEPHPFGIGE